MNIIFKPGKAKKALPGKPGLVGDKGLDGVNGMDGEPGNKEGGGEGKSTSELTIRCSLRTMDVPFGL